jgi:poly(A) polymerase Pap1
MLNRDVYSVDRKQLKRNTYGFTGTAYGRDTAAHGIASYSTTKSRKVILNTDFLNDLEWQWVDELISSPVVYLDGNIPVNITNTQVEVFDLNDGPQQLRIEVEYTEPEILQNI